MLGFFIRWQAAHTWIIIISYVLLFAYLIHIHKTLLEIERERERGRKKEHENERVSLTVREVSKSFIESELESEQETTLRCLVAFAANLSLCWTHRMWRSCQTVRNGADRFGSGHTHTNHTTATIQSQRRRRSWNTESFCEPFLVAISCACVNNCA